MGNGKAFAYGQNIKASMLLSTKMVGNGTIEQVP
jgi:hypothetical protein